MMTTTMRMMTTTTMTMKISREGCLHSGVDGKGVSGQKPQGLWVQTFPPELSGEITFFKDSSYRDAGVDDSKGRVVRLDDAVVGCVRVSWQ